MWLSIDVGLIVAGLQFFIVYVFVCVFVGQNIISFFISSFRP